MYSRLVELLLQSIWQRGRKVAEHNWWLHTSRGDNDRRRAQKKSTAAAMIFLFYQSLLLGVIYRGSTRYFAVELELTFMGHISGSTALRVVPVLFPPVSMGCWDEVNFKPYKRCHKLHVMANSSLSFLRLRSSAADYSRSSDVAWRIAWVTPNKWGGRSAPIYLHRRRGERVKIRHVLSLL